MSDWSAWRLDLFTWGWIVWILFFFVWESAALYARTGQELTEHLRPVFASQPVVWFLAVGLWLWLGVHLLAWQWEHRIVDFFVDTLK